MKDWLFLVWPILIVAVIAFGIWLRVAAPCEYVNWLPVADVPTRCLIEGVNK